VTRYDYDREADRLLKEFVKHYNPGGPAMGHSSQEARDASADITRHALNFNPEWYAKPKPPEQHDPA
jgi:hypothetical protein